MLATERLVDKTIWRVVVGWFDDASMSVDASVHEGFALGILPDGTVPTYLIGGYRAERHYMDGHWDGDDAGVPDGPPAFLRPKCACGWRGQDVEMVEDDLFEMPELEARNAWNEHAATVSSGMESARLIAEARAAVAALWDSPAYSAAPSVVLDRLRGMAGVERAVTEVTGALVGAAREHGKSWSEIGGAVGLSRAAAHTRYRHLAGPAEDQVDDDADPG
jgi:hypothetical protein